MFEYKCPECDAVLKSPREAPAGRKIRCKKCDHAFVPGGTLALAEEEPKADAGKAARDAAAKDRFGDIENDDNPYKMAADEGGPAAEKIDFERVKDKFKRSSRGPAMALLVLPTNLLVAQGGLIFFAGIGTIIAGMFPLVFADVEPSEDEYREQASVILMGLVGFVWGCLICFGASQMQNLESYTWGWVGAISGIPAGIFAMVMLRNPKVVEGFKEMVGALDDDDVKDKDDDDDEDDDDEDDDEDE
jgi:hypothetical protein